MNKVVVGLFCLALSGCANAGSSGSWSEFDVVDAASDVQEEDAPASIYEAGTPPLPLEAGGFDLGYAETDPITYQGGAVMTDPITIYYVWYGNWTDNKVAPLLEDFARNIGSSDWYSISTKYYQFQRQTEAGAGVVMPQVREYVSGQVSFGGSIYIGAPYGNSLVDHGIENAVLTAITTDAGALPTDLNAVYFVFTSAEVNETSGWCNSYCGWHGNYDINGKNLRIAFVGDTGSCSNCSLQDEYKYYGIDKSPNGNWSADSMVSVIAHELSESATDPDVNSSVAWEDDYAYENSDKCAWLYGLPYLTNTGSVANIKVGNRDWMVQQNWVLDDAGIGHCGLKP